MLNRVEELRNEEPEQLRELSKSKIFELLGRTYFLPDKDSRCITRAYLVAVHTGAVYRVERTQLLNFEVDLTFQEKVKSSFFHMGILRQRADILLQQLGLLPFGFPNNTNADEGWFVRVLRMIDPYNILGAFKTRINDARLPRIPAGQLYFKIHHSYLAKERLELAVFTGAMRQNKNIQKMVLDITETSKSKKILQKEIADHEAELARLRESLRERIAEKTQQIFNLAMLVVQLRNPEGGDGQLDQIFVDGDQVGIQVRENIQTITTALSIVYDLDPITPVDQVPLAARAIINNHTEDW